MSKILICVPIILNADVAREAIKQIVDQKDVTVVLCNNGGDQHIKNVINEFALKPDVSVWTRSQNVYVNPIWNDFIEYFLIKDEWDHLIIMNSDLTLQKDWAEVVKNRWEKRPHESLIPQVLDDKNLMFIDEKTEYAHGIQAYEGIPGIFITLTKKQAGMIFPLPKECKIWFGDTWLYSILVALGEKVVSPENLKAFHHHSTSVQKVPRAYEIIEEDKIAWQKIVHPLMVEKIKHLKGL